MAKSMRARLPKVLILYTGGTFGMVVSGGPAGLGREAGIEGTLALPRLSPTLLRTRLERHVPELARLASCEVEVLMNRDSAHLGPEDWVSIAHAIESRWRRFDGIVLLHGTDTLPYTASALSFILRPCLKPVVITGAQKPLSVLRSDARRNLISAVEIAAGGPRKGVSQVTVLFDDVLLQGNRVRKRSATEFAAFRAPRAEPLARIGTSIDYTSRLESPSGRALAPKLEARFSRRVALLQVTPALPAAAIEKALPSLDALGLVIFPSATAPTNDVEFLRMLREARRRGLFVFLAVEGITRAPGEVPNPLSYEAGRALVEAGCFWSGAMTPECAFVKASLLLGQKGGQALAAEWWYRDLAGEGSWGGFASAVGPPVSAVRPPVKTRKSRAGRRSAL